MEKIKVTYPGLTATITSISTSKKVTMKLLLQTLAPIDLSSAINVKEHFGLTTLKLTMLVKMKKKQF
jgi:hypothetical protein